LLEIYLNIIEWGPGIHGADEAARFYFDRDAHDLTLDQSLFLSTVIPSPSRWRGRLDANGDARRYVKEQMHFIGRAMIAKGWLPPEALPPADALRVELVARHGRSSSRTGYVPTRNSPREGDLTRCFDGVGDFLLSAMQPSIQFAHKTA